MKGDSSDLRLDIERRKKISVGEQDCDQDKEKGLGDPPVPSKGKSSEKSSKRHKKSKYVPPISKPFWNMMCLTSLLPLFLLPVKEHLCLYSFKEKEEETFSLEFLLVFLFLLDCIPAQSPSFLPEPVWRPGLQQDPPGPERTPSTRRGRGTKRRICKLRIWCLLTISFWNENLPFPTAMDGLRGVEPMVFKLNYLLSGHLKRDVTGVLQVCSVGPLKMSAFLLLFF